MDTRPKMDFNKNNTDNKKVFSERKKGSTIAPLLYGHPSYKATFKRDRKCKMLLRKAFQCGRGGLIRGGHIFSSPCKKTI